MSRIKLSLALLLIGGLVSSCAYLPSQKSEPVATVIEGDKSEGLKPEKALIGQLFVITHIDDKRVMNAVWRLNLSRRFSSPPPSQWIYPSAMGIKVPARKIKVRLLATTYLIDRNISYADEKPTRKSAGVIGEVEFTPKLDAWYKVNGTITHDGSEIWIEEESGQVVTEKVSNKS